MKLGGVFLIFALIVLVAAMVFMFFFEAPVKAGAATEFVRPQDCGLNQTCLGDAMLANCQKATFSISSPFTENAYLDGEVTGTALGKCVVEITDPASGDMMTCYIKEPISSIAESYEQLSSSCSGPLWDKLN
jgi:hypothetical protein